MSGVVQLLQVRITSALAVKPSTVYVIEIENVQTRHVWHLRRCFSAFAELRERLLVLLDAQTSGANGSSGVASTSSSGRSTAFGALPTTRAALRALSGGGSAASSPAKSSSPARDSRANDAVAARFPFLYAKFPRRQFFGSRTKRVIEQRTVALNEFLQDALRVVQEARMQHSIAIYFSLMTQLETFLECDQQLGVATAMPMPVPMTMPLHMPPSCFPSRSRSPSPSPPRESLVVLPLQHADAAATRSLAGPEAAALAAKCASPRPSRPTAMTYRDSSDDDERIAWLADDGRLSDDELDMHMLKKTTSCFMSFEVQERMQPSTRQLQLGTRASDKDPCISAADAWAARIEIAGIASAMARREKTNMLPPTTRMTRASSNPASLEPSAHSSASRHTLPHNGFELQRSAPECA